MNIKKIIVSLLMAVMICSCVTTTTYAASSSSTKTEASKKTTKKKTKQKTKKVNYTKAQLRLLSCLIYAEANGEPYAGKVAVGIVVQNRVKSASFPNTLRDVIYQPYQFGPARNGSLSRAIKEYKAGNFTSQAELDCIKAAKTALSDTTTIKYSGRSINMKSYLYFSGWVSGARLQIANHQFK